jgi:hypothetical protein
MSTPPDRPVSLGLEPRLPAVLSPTLRRVLALLGVLFGLLAVNSLYLVAVTAAEWVSGEILENRVYLLMFLLHLALGLILAVPLVLFGVLHLRRAWRRPNRWAVRAGLGLFTTLILLLLSGILLTRFGFFEINHPGVRSWSYWIHVTTPSSRFGCSSCIDSPARRCGGDRWWPGAPPRWFSQVLRWGFISALADRATTWFGRSSLHWRGSRTAAPSRRSV